MGGYPPLLTDSEVDSIAWEFLRSHYVGTVYAHWPLDRRLDSFLRRHSPTRVADDGDLCTIILDRIMAYAGLMPRSLHETITTAS